MSNTLIFYSLMLALVIAGAWGLSRIEAESDTVTHEENLAPHTQVQETFRPVQEHTPSTEVSKKVTDNNYFQDILADLHDGDARQAAFAINDSYSYLSSSELEQLKLEFIKLAASSNEEQRKQILLSASKAFDDIEVWELLSLAAENTGDWPLAYSAQLKTSKLENDPVKLEALLERLVRSSSHIRADHEKNNDLLSVKTLYQELVDLHPHFTRFQLELAHSHVRLGDFEPAKTLYESLSYDPEFGQIAQNTLAKINQSETPDSAAISNKPAIDPVRRNDIVVPLIPVGSSFLVDTDIDRQRSRLLLDTGASITSLSTNLIERLNLAPTGQSIRLSTANGITRARLFKVDSLRLGRLTLKNMVVAEIDLNQRNSFEGLLGTDALNQFKSKYSYIIDNQKNALIFRAL